MAKPRNKLLRFWDTLKETGKAFGEIDPLTEASSLAFTTIFAIPGVIIIALMVAGTFYDAEALSTALYSQAGGFVGPETSEDLQAMVERAGEQESGLFAKILGVLALVFSATAAFASLQSSLNKIWRVQMKPGRAVLRYLLTRLRSLGLIAGFGFLLLISLVLDAGLVIVGERLGNWLPGQALLVGMLGLTLSFGVVTLVFALVFKLLPDMKVLWRSVWVGALFTAALFTLGKYLIGLYIAKSGAGAAYGAGGAVIIIMLWVYYSSILMLFGAQYTYVTARKRGDIMQPVANAVRTGKPK